MSGDSWLGAGARPTLLSINNYHYRRGGAEVVFLEHNEMFRARGWEVLPFCMRHPQNQPSPWEQHFVDEIEFGSDYSLARKLANASKVIYSFEARRRIETLLRARTPAVAHAHNVYHHISPAIFGTLADHGVPVVLTLHDLKIACPAYKMLTHDGVCERCRGGALWNVAFHRCVKDSRALSALVMLESSVHRLLGCYTRHVARFIVPSRFYLEKFVEWGFPRDRFYYIPNFVDTGSLRPQADASDAFVYFGRLAPEKGLATLVRAVARAGVRARVVGTGPELPALQRLAGELEADVEFMGYRTGAELHAIVATARAVVLPSEWYENAPMTLMEAYALGRPVVGATIGGIPELIRPGETGWGFPSGDALALAEVLQQVAAQPETRLQAMGRTGRAWMESDFTPGAYAQRVLALYGGLGVAG